MALTVDASRGTLTAGPEALSPWSRDLRESVRAEAREYTERLLLVAESFRASAGEPWREMRWARATANVLAHCPVRIRHGERLVGWHPNSSPDEPTRQALDEARAYLRSQCYWTNAMEGHMALDNPNILAEGLDARLARLRALRAAVDPSLPESPARPDSLGPQRLCLRGHHARRLYRRHHRVHRPRAERRN